MLMMKLDRDGNGGQNVGGMANGVTLSMVKGAGEERRIAKNLSYLKAAGAEGRRMTAKTYCILYLSVPMDANLLLSMNITP